MNGRVEPPRRGNDPRQAAQEQFAIEIATNLYAVFAAAVVCRTILLLLEIDPRLWVTRTIFRYTSPLQWPFLILPGGERHLVRELTLADISLVAAAILFPLGFLATRRGKTTDSAIDQF